MEKRVPASMRTRQSLIDPIEGRLVSPARREEVAKLAMRLIVEEALEANARNTPGHDYDKHAAAPGLMVGSREGEAGPSGGRT